MELCWFGVGGVGDWVDCLGVSVGCGGLFLCSWWDVVFFFV